MRFIHSWSYMFANLLMNQLKENHEKRRVYYYGFQIVIGALVKGSLLIATSLLLGSLVPTLFLVLIFGSLRMLAGGYHMDTYGKCIMTSLGMFVILGTISQYSHQHWSIISLVVLVAISFIVGIAAIIKWAPSDTPNKPITKPEEIRKFKILSVVYCMAWIAAVSIVLFLRMEALLSVKFNVFILSASFGLLLETFTISPAGYRFFDLISGKIRR